MSPQDRSPITKTTTPTTGETTSTSAETTTISPPKGPTYNPELAAALNKFLFDKKPTSTALNNHFFGKKHTPNAETMTPVNGETTQAYRSRIAQMTKASPASQLPPQAPPMQWPVMPRQFPPDCQRSPRQSQERAPSYLEDSTPLTSPSPLHLPR